MDIFKKDMILQQIARQIKKNQNNIGQGVGELYKIKDKNDSLREVYEDYKGYKDYIVNMKKDQEIQILGILHYLEKSMLEANLTDRMVNEAKHEQQILLEKLKTVRNDLDEITEKAENL
jgi:hypothetical protein